MALSTGSTETPGTGQFVAETVWSCPLHEQPETHECDCDHCDIPFYTCEGCAHADWVDKRDETGAVVMREVSFYEQMMRRSWKAEDARVSAFLGLMAKTADPVNVPIIRWIEDEPSGSDH